ncbi:MAG: glycosyltransferase family 39 protein [Candidatus Omnitrophica bacterium]|nr:glycosyltransferase family 39 protein [Candidatus Omnitrophota bacterium]
MGFLSTILFIVVTTFAGFNVIILFDRQGVLTMLEKIGLSYLFGIGAISLELFFLWIFGIKLNMLFILLPWLFLIVLNVLTRSIGNVFSPAKRSVDTENTPISIFEKWILSLLSFEVLYTFFRSLMRPVEAYDSVAIWSLKGKILYLTKTLPGEFFNMLSATFHGVHPDYPLLVPFSEAWFYTLFNNFNDYLVKIIFPLNFTAFLLVFYSVLRRVTHKRNLALFFTFALASVKQFNDYATIGVADLQTAIYAFLAFGFLFIWAREKNTVYLFISGLSCVFAFFTKNEGSVVLLTMVGMLLAFAVRPFFGKKLSLNSRAIIFAIFTLSALLLGWSLFKAGMHLENDVINAETFRNIRLVTMSKRLIPIAYEYQKHIFGFKKWNLIWIAFLCAIFVKSPKLSFGRHKLILFPTLAILAGYTVIYLITPQSISWHLAASASRLLIHILPLAVFFVALRINDLYYEK